MWGKRFFTVRYWTSKFFPPALTPVGPVEPEGRVELLSIVARRPEAVLTATLVTAIAVSTQPTAELLRFEAIFATIAVVEDEAEAVAELVPVDIDQTAVAAILVVTKVPTIEVSVARIAPTAQISRSGGITADIAVVMSAEFELVPS